MGGLIPDWYKKKKAAKSAKDGILKLIEYLSDKVSSKTETESSNS